MEKKLYTAHCIENGERFTTHFYHTETNKQKLLQIGRDLASEWGGECTSIREWKPEYFVKLTHKQTGKTIRATVKQWDAWRKKHLDDCLNTDPSNPYKVEADGHTEAPKSAWDYTKTEAENLAAVK